MTPYGEWHLDRQFVGRRVLLFDTVHSTNDLALKLIAAGPAESGTIVLANQQLAGRGRLGRKWLCPAGKAVLLSVLLYPPKHLHRHPALTAWAAMSACDTVQQLSNQSPWIKWPNDVYIGGKKICGVLIESKAETAVAGIGLNVSQTAEEFYALGLLDAISLASFSNACPVVPNVAKALIQHLDQRYVKLCQGPRVEFEHDWSQRVGLVGQEVQLRQGRRTLTGILRTMTLEQIQLEFHGTLHTFSSHSVHTLSAASQSAGIDHPRHRTTGSRLV
jgi:BirA family biotin operon repressor/biotin-[acetyl-CoA-carboxylase] ligase